MCMKMTTSVQQGITVHVKTNILSIEMCLAGFLNDPVYLVSKTSKGGMVVDVVVLDS